MQFRMDWFLFALAMHITMCLLVGLLYGAMLPLLPRRPIVLGGIIGPLLWTGLLYHVLGYVNPLLDERINWWWFAALAGRVRHSRRLVVARQNKVLTAENLPLAMRAGIEAPGLMHERDDEDGSDENACSADFVVPVLACALSAGCNLPGKPTPAQNRAASDRRSRSGCALQAELRRMPRSRRHTRTGTAYRRSGVSRHRQ